MTRGLDKGPKGGGALNSPGEIPWRAGHAQERVPEADSGGGRSDSAESSRDTGAGKGMTGGDHLSSAAAREEAELGWRRRFGPAGPC
jgi:hypothetical protein